MFVYSVQRTWSSKNSCPPHVSRNILRHPVKNPSQDMPSLILGKGIHHIPLIKPIHNPCSENQELRSGHVPHQLHINASNPHEVVVELRKLFAKNNRPGQGSRFEGWS